MRLAQRQEQTAKAPSPGALRFGLQSTRDHATLGRPIEGDAAG
jgi:hypothetical protein